MKRNNKERKYMQFFLIAMVVTIVLSVCVGIVSVENGKWSINNAEAAKNANSEVTDTQESFSGDVPVEIKVPQGKEKLKVAEKRRVDIPQEGGKDISFPIVSQNKNGLRVFSSIKNATRGALVIKSQSNESRNIEIQGIAQNEMSITNRKIAEDFKTKSDSKLTLQPAMSDSSIEKPSSNLAIIIVNETTAFVEWRMNAPGEYAAYIPFYKDRGCPTIQNQEKNKD